MLKVKEDQSLSNKIILIEESTHWFQQATFCNLLSDTLDKWAVYDSIKENIGWETAYTNKECSFYTLYKETIIKIEIEWLD